MENVMGHLGPLGPRTGPREHSHWNRLVLELGFPGLASQTARWEAVSWTCQNLLSPFGDDLDGFEALAGQLCPRDGWFRGSVRATLSTRCLWGSGAAFPLKSSIFIFFKFTFCNFSFLFVSKCSTFSNIHFVFFNFRDYFIFSVF